jgi:murein DD-endopeptidase MepM/ murein hydrolase activator NlpD
MLPSYPKLFEIINIKVKYFFLTLITIFGFFLYKLILPKPPQIGPTTNLSPTPTSFQRYSFPIVDFQNRITKKPFGIYITPENSPVKPEKFTGYHTGVDIEYGDITTNIPVLAIYPGTVIYSGFVKGYGGLVAIQHPNFISLYGHLKPASLVKNNSKVEINQSIGILGKAYSPETDGERKHLHFAIIKGNKLYFRGYVQNQSELKLWLNPLDLY